MPRPVWTGSIAFGLVNVPVKLYSATESHRLAFHELEKGTGQRIRYRRVAEGSDREVPWEKIQKGFEVGKDRFVVLSDEELAAAAPERNHTVEIAEFVPLADIDPVSFDASYYAAPDGAAAAKAYVLLRDVMRKEKRVAIGRFVLRTKEYVACIRPRGDVLTLHTMFFADEVRDAEEIVDLPARTNVSERELAMAGQLVGALAKKWEPGAHEDTFRERVLALVKKKGDGDTIDTTPEREKSPRITDLMEALKATLAAPAASSPRRGAARARARSAPPTRRERVTRTRKQGGTR